MEQKNTKNGQEKKKKYQLLAGWWDDEGVVCLKLIFRCFPLPLSYSVPHHENDDDDCHIVTRRHMHIQNRHQ